MTRSASDQPPVVRIGSVSYLNAKPLIYGLDSAENVRLDLRVPSRLIDGLRDESFDIALLPVIDYQRLAGLRVVPSGGIGCDGPTLTVRIFSRVPIGQIKVLACDTDSHTSVALARVLLAEHFGVKPEFVDLNRVDFARALSRDDGFAQLLIGDKVVCEEPAGMEHQIDLGAAWKQMTGLPFVFAVWVARAEVENSGINISAVADRLRRAKQAGLEHVNDLIAKYAVPRGWPSGLALQYLTSYLKFDIGDAQLQAIRLFHQLAAKHGIVPNPPRPLDVV
jgi:chorismate dehydratase